MSSAYKTSRGRHLFLSLTLTLLLASCKVSILSSGANDVYAELYEHQHDHLSLDGVTDDTQIVRPYLSRSKDNVKEEIGWSRSDVDPAIFSHNSTKNRDDDVKIVRPDNPVFRNINFNRKGKEVVNARTAVWGVVTEPVPQ